MVWCPEPPRSETIAYNFYDYRSITQRVKQGADVRYVRHPFDAESGRVVSYCLNHAVDRLQDDIGCGGATLNQGRYPAVREDGGALLVRSEGIVLWCLDEGKTWHEKRKPAHPMSGQWRFPNEPWPPAVPF
jgi:hypothetical protein